MAWSCPHRAFLFSRCTTQDLSFMMLVRQLQKLCLHTSHCYIILVQTPFLNKPHFCTLSLLIWIRAVSTSHATTWMLSCLEFLPNKLLRVLFVLFLIHSQVVMVWTECSQILCQDVNINRFYSSSWKGPYSLKLYQLGLLFLAFWDSQLPPEWPVKLFLYP